MEPGQTELRTEWFDGRQPKPHRVWVRRVGDELVLRGMSALEPNEQRYRLRDIRWPERRSHGLRQAELPDGGLIQHGDAGEWDQWFAANGLRESPVVVWMQSWRGALGAALGTVAFLAVAWLWGVPLLSGAIARSIPHSIETSIGDVSMKQLAALFLDPSELPQDQQTRIRRDFDRLVQAAYPQGDAPQWRLAFHNSEALGANAFALPGGQIVVTDDLVKMLDDVPDATLGVLAHELGHVEHRHGLDLVVRASLVSALVGVVIGDASGFLATVPATLVTQGYSRDAEREADAHAAAMLHASGISPAVMATFFERVTDPKYQPKGKRVRAPGDEEAPTSDADAEEESSTLSIGVASHPDEAERIRFFKNWTPANSGMASD
jgi:Zn-dependent protease with chaperone function